MNKIIENVEESSNNLKKIMIGTFISITITLVFLLIFSTILTYTNISERTINPVIIVITAISILIGSSITTSKIKNKGILNGGIIGIIYITLIYLLSSIIQGDFSLTISAFIMIISSIIAGMLGGIIGVNR